MVARRDFPTALRCRQTFFSEAVEKPESTLTPHIISASAQTKPVIAINIRFMTLLCCSNRNTHAEEKDKDEGRPVTQHDMQRNNRFSDSHPAS